MDIEKQIELFERLARIEENTKEIPALTKRVERLEGGVIKQRAFVAGAVAVGGFAAKYILPVLMVFAVVHGTPPDLVFSDKTPLVDYVTGFL